MENERFLTNIINNFLEHILILNSEKKLIFCSNKIENLLGYNSTEISEMGFKKMFLNKHFSLQEAFVIAERHDEWFSTENFLHKTRNFINVAFRLYFQIDESTQEKLYVFYLRDNTQQQIVRRDIIKKSVTIENLSKSRKIRDGKITEAIYELLESCSRAMSTTRVNAWLFDENKNEIQCIGNFDARKNELIPQSALPRIAMPFYFSLFETEKIIITANTFTETKTAELFEFYLKPLDIQSLMDVPVRIEGEMIGVICFENVGAPRIWTLQEQKFALVAAQMLSLTIESYNKQNVKGILELAIKEKETLLQELHHRVKNNLSIVASLLNMQSEKATDNYHKDLFLESRNRLDSIASVHELIYKSKSYSSLNFKDYLSQIIDYLAKVYDSNSKIKIIQNISDVHIDISFALPLALIVNELITNSYKHAFTQNKNGVIELVFNETENQVLLTITDNGVGFDKKRIEKKSMGMDITDGLIDQINGKCIFESNGNGTKYEISFSKK